tara:strand:- start:191 stop:511 length:321 start_codon:yes stop_codon:yes gene_type:complete
MTDEFIQAVRKAQAECSELVEAEQAKLPGENVTEMVGIYRRIEGLMGMHKGLTLSLDLYEAACMMNGGTPSDKLKLTTGQIEATEEMTEMLDRGLEDKVGDDKCSG